MVTIKKTYFTIPGVEPIPLVVGQPRLVAGPRQPVVVVAESLGAATGNS